MNEIPAGGGAVTTPSTRGGFYGIATDGAYIYWSGSDGVYRVPIGGGPTTSVEPPEDDAGSPIDAGSAFEAGEPPGIVGPIVVDAENIYLLLGSVRFNLNTYVYSGEVFETPLQIPTPGGTTLDVGTSQGDVADFAISGKNVYYADSVSA